MEKSRFNELLKDLEKFDLTDEERAKLSGSFIKLESGNTHYEMKGEGEPVVLVHGYATPYFIYDKIFDFLVKEGYKVIRYDLLGRGFSERVNEDYTPELFARQLDDLTKALIPGEKFYLFGTSMGGSIVTAYAAKHPENVKKLLLLAPAGMWFDPPAYMKLAQKPVIGDVMFKVAGGKILFKNCSAELIYSKDENDYYLEKFAESIRYKGFVRSTLSSLRNTILRWDTTIPNYRAVAINKTPVCTIWGTADNTMPYYQSKQMKSLLPDMHFYTFEGSGHLFLFDEGERTCEIIKKEMQE